LESRDAVICKECGHPARKPVTIIGQTVCQSCSLEYAVKILGEDAQYPTQEASHAHAKFKRMEDVPPQS